MHRKMAIALAAIVVSSATGCGSDHRSGSLSKAEFDRQVDAICSRAIKTLSATESTRFDVVLKAQEAFFDDQIAALAAVKPPQALVGAFGDYKRSLDARRALVRETYATARSAGPRSAPARALERRQGRQFAKAAGLTQRLGLKICR